MCLGGRLEDGCVGAGDTAELVEEASPWPAEGGGRHGGVRGCRNRVAVQEKTPTGSES